MIKWSQKCTTHSASHAFRMWPSTAFTRTFSHSPTCSTYADACQLSRLRGLESLRDNGLFKALVFPDLSPRCFYSSPTISSMYSLSFLGGCTDGLQTVLPISFAQVTLWSPIGVHTWQCAGFILKWTKPLAEKPSGPVWYPLQIIYESHESLLVGHYGTWYQQRSRTEIVHVN